MIKHSFTHPFDVEEAHQVADQAFAFYQKKHPGYKLRMQWETDEKAKISVTIKNISITGNVLLQPGLVHIELLVPLIFRMFEKQALYKIDAEMRRWFPETKKAID